jgi:hypothetical protein
MISEMTEKPPPALVAAPEKTGGETGLPGTTHQPGFGDKTPENGGTEDKKKSREMRKYRSLWRVSSQNHYI